MQYTFEKAYNSLKGDKLAARLAIMRILGITSKMQFYRIMKGETPIRADKISDVENELKKYGITKIWD